MLGEALLEKIVDVFRTPDKMLGVLTIKPKGVGLQEPRIARAPFNQHPDAKEENRAPEDPRRMPRQPRNLVNQVSYVNDDSKDGADNPADELKLLLGALRKTDFSNIRHYVLAVVKM